jgi:hypothetical protein
LHITFIVSPPHHGSSESYHCANPELRVFLTTESGMLASVQRTLELANSSWNILLL